ncbi:MAG TPA: sugar ABC transporter substrate-binding protein [Longimicrobiales bacterium]
MTRASGVAAALRVPILAASVWLAACGADRGAGVVLDFWALGQEGARVRELVRDFERENPGIRVDVQQIPWTAAHEKLLTAYVGEATPDVAQIGNTWIAEFAALRAIEPLGRWIEASAVVEPDAYFGGIWATNQLDGIAYGVPWYVDTRVIFYRKDILTRAGYDAVPSSWAGWREALERIQAQADAGEYAIFLPTDEWAQPVILGLQAGSPLLRDGGRYGAFEAPAFRRAFDFYLGLYRDGLAPVLANTQVANVYQEFARGTFAMWITGPWNIGEFRRRLPSELQDRWATAPLPGPTGAASGISLAGGSSLVIFRASAHKPEAWKLIEYLSRREQQVRFYRLTGDLPARREAWQDPALAGNRHARAFREQLERVAPLPQVPEMELIANKVYEHAEAAIRGVASAEAVLAALDRDVDRILEKRRWLLRSGT